MLRKGVEAMRSLASPAGGSLCSVAGAATPMQQAAHALQLDLPGSPAMPKPPSLFVESPAASIDARLTAPADTAGRTRAW